MVRDEYDDIVQTDETDLMRYKGRKKVIDPTSITYNQYDAPPIRKMKAKARKNKDIASRVVRAMGG